MLNWWWSSSSFLLNKIEFKPCKSTTKNLKSFFIWHNHKVGWSSKIMTALQCLHTGIHVDHTCWLEWSNNLFYWSNYFRYIRRGKSKTLPKHWLLGFFILGQTDDLQIYDNCLLCETPSSPIGSFNASRSWAAGCRAIAWSWIHRRRCSYGCMGSTRRLTKCTFDRLVYSCGTIQPSLTVRILFWSRFFVTQCGRSDTHRAALARYSIDGNIWVVRACVPVSTWVFSARPRPLLHAGQHHC